jgi:hypothetical protein
VRRWESDNPPWPQPDHQAALEALFQRPITDLGFTPPWDAEASGRPQEAASNRHAFAAPAPIGAGAIASFPSRAATGRLPASVATDYISITAAHRRLYWSIPAARLHRPVATHANLGAELLSAMPEAARISLASAVAESNMLAGRLEFFDLQQPEAAQESFVIALQAAQDARDPLLGSAVLAHMAFIPAFSGDTNRAEEAQDKIRAARAFARRGPASPEMLAWLDAVEAEVETRFGHTRKALRLIGHAEDIFANEEKRPSPDAKQRAVTLSDLAAVAVSENDPEQACRLAESALDNLARYWYATGMDRVRAVRQSLEPWESLPCVRQLDERLYDWNTTVRALTG